MINCYAVNDGIMCVQVRRAALVGGHLQRPESVLLRSCRRRGVPCDTDHACDQRFSGCQAGRIADETRTKHDELHALPGRFCAPSHEAAGSSCRCTVTRSRANAPLAMFHQIYRVADLAAECALDLKDMQQSSSVERPDRLLDLNQTKRTVPFGSRSSHCSFSTQLTSQLRRRAISPALRGLYTKLRMETAMIKASGLRTL